MKMDGFRGGSLSSFFILLFFVAEFGIQDSGAAMCSFNIPNITKEKGFFMIDTLMPMPPVACDGCAAWMCGSEHVLGCIGNIFASCQEFKGDLKFINSTNPADMDYFKFEWNENGTVPIAYYVSGCSDETCMKTKMEKFVKEYYFGEKLKDMECEEGEQIVWHTNSTGAECRKKAPNAGGDNNSPETKSGGDGGGSAENGSIGIYENALKFIGMMTAAAALMLL